MNVQFKLFVVAVAEEAELSTIVRSVRSRTCVLVILPLVMFLTAAPASAQDTSDFSRIRKAINHEIALVEEDGTVRRGTLEEVTADHATVRFAGLVKALPRHTIASVERLRDGVLGGAIKGAVVGAVLGLATLGYPEGTRRAGMWIASTVVCSGIGLAFDAMYIHRELLYRAPPNASMALTFRF